MILLGTAHLRSYRWDNNAYEIYHLGDFSTGRLYQPRSAPELRHIQMAAKDGQVYPEIWEF